jgi:hypothetical protein
MFTLSTTNGITKTFSTLADAQEYCAARFMELTWEHLDVYLGGDGLQWQGFDGSDDTAHATIALDAEELVAWATEQAARHIADVRSMGATPSPRDAGNWEGILDIERRAIRRALRDLLEEEAA